MIKLIWISVVQYNSENTPYEYPLGNLSSSSHLILLQPISIYIHILCFKLCLQICALILSMTSVLPEFWISFIFAFLIYGLQFISLMHLLFSPFDIIFISIYVLESAIKIKISPGLTFPLRLTKFVHCTSQLKLQIIAHFSILISPPQVLFMIYSKSLSQTAFHLNC